MSKLYNRIDDIDLTSIIAENEFTDKFKESDTKYCKECFNSFIGEGDICDDCKKRLELEEVSDEDRDVLAAAREINDALAINDVYDITELSASEQKDLILDTLKNVFGSYRVTDDFVKAVCSEIGADYHIVFEETSDEIEESTLNEIDNNAYVVYINTDKGPSYLGANGETLDVNAALKFNNEDQANESLVDMINKSSNPNAGNYKVAKVGEVAVKEADENVDDIDPEVTDDLVDDTAKDMEVKDEEPENVEPAEGEEDEEASEESDDEEDELEDTLDDIEDDIEEIQKQISELKAGLEGLDKTDDVSDDDKILVDGKEYTKASAESEIKSLEEKLEKLSKNKNESLNDAPLKEEEVSFDEIVTRMANATSYDELYAAIDLIVDAGIRTRAEEIVNACEKDGDDVETAYSVATSEAIDPYINDLNEEESVYKTVKLPNGNFADIYKRKDGFYDANGVKLTDEEIEEYKLNEADGSAKTFSQWFDEWYPEANTVDPDDDEFYPFDNYVKVFKSAETLRNATADDIMKNAYKFYDVYPVDSSDREHAFTFAAEELGIDYEDLYQSWLNERPLVESEKINEAIATITTVDNIDQESKDDKIIKKAVKLTKKEKTIDNDTFRQLRLELADKDYDVIDRLKDYALVRGEDVIYTWLRAEDKNLKESDELKVGDKFENENGVTVEIISIDADKEGNDQCTYKMTLDGRDTFKCYAPENVANMLRDNHYTKLNESVNIDIVDGDVTVTTDTTNIHVSETGEPAADLGKEPIISPEDIMPAEEPAELPEELPESDDFKTHDEIARENGVEFATPEQTNTLDDKAKDAVKAMASDEETDLNEDDIPSNDLQMEIYELIVDGKEVDDQDIETNIKETLDAVMADHADLDREDIEEFIRDKAEEIYSADEEDNSEEIAQLEDRILDYERNGRGSEEQYQRDLDRLHELRGLDEDGMQVNDIPSKNDQDHRHKRLELAKFESEDNKITYRISYLNESDEEIAGWDLEVDDDDKAFDALDNVNGLLNTDFKDTGIDNIQSADFNDTNLMLNTDDDQSILTITQGDSDPVIIKGAGLEDILNQLVGWYIESQCK